MGTLNWLSQISYQTKWDLHIFIHLPGDEMWMSYIAFPFGLTYLRLDVNNSDGMASTDLTIAETDIVLLDTPSIPCKSYIEQVLKFDLKSRTVVP